VLQYKEECTLTTTIAVTTVEPQTKAVSNRYIYTHQCADAEEYFGAWGLRRFKPGMEKAEIIYIRDGKLPREYQSIGELYAQGHYALGILNSPHDEHARNGKPRKAPSSATLVFRELGLEEDPRIKKILAYIESNDADGTNDGWHDWANTVKDMHRAKANPKLIEAWIFFAFDVTYQKEVRFQKTNTEFKEGMVSEKNFQSAFPPFNRHQLVTVRSNNDQMGRRIRHKRISAGVIVKSTGNIIVASNHALNPEMVRVVVELRRAEATRRGIFFTEEELSQEGEFAFWYWQIKGQMILNGSEKTEVEPTRLPIEQIEQIVKKFAEFKKKK
jgi:hypothetical protein